MSLEYLRLADVLVPQRNGRPVQLGWSPQCHTHPATEGRWGVLKTTAIQAGWFDPTQNKELPDGLEPRPHIEVKAGDLLMTCAGPRARCGVPTLVRHTPERLLISGKMYRFRPNDRVLASYLEMWLLSPDTQELIDGMKTGISDSGLNLTHGRFVELQVPVPPIDEQHRIVEAMSAHLSRLDAAEKSLERSLLRLNALRDAALSEALAQASHSSGVQVTTIGALGKVSSGMTPLKSNRAFYDGGTVPWITSGDLYQGLITKATQFVTQAALSQTSLKIMPIGSLLIAMYGEGKTRGTAAELGIEATTNQACAVVVLDDSDLTSWVRLVLDANYAKFRRLAAGGVQPNLNLSIVKALEMPIPNADLRVSLVRRQAERYASIDRLREELSGAKRRSSSLRKSLLRAAFNGTASVQVAKRSSNFVPN